MLKRAELEKYLSEQCENIALHSEKREKVCEILLEKYSIPTGLTMDMICREKIMEQDDDILFCLLDGIGNLIKKEDILSAFFTPIEIEMYSKKQFKQEKIKFPLIIPCFQVADDQWIGAADTNFFMKLRAAQLINYNENTQRALTKIVTAHGIQYKITTKKATVSKIRASLHAEEYIPTAITLNIPIEETDFDYDEERHALVINSLKYFDIADGYHRYVSMCLERIQYPSFNYPWELRITNFPEDKAKYFTYQEAQKTEMTVNEKNSRNSYALANRIATDLNKDTTFELFKEINDIGGKISYTEFIKVVDYFYCQDSKKGENDNQIKRTVQMEIKNKINYLVSVDDSYATKKYTYVDILVMIYVFQRVDKMEMLDKYIKSISENIHQKIDKRKLQPAKKISKPLINDLDNLFEEV